MIPQPYSQLVRFKQWAGRGLYQVVGDTIGRLEATDAAILVRLLDHIHVVDGVFQHHLQRLPHGFDAPRSGEVPEISTLLDTARALDDWYVNYVDSLSPTALDEPIDFVFTSGKPACMTRGEMILHICLHGTYHRGNAGIILQKNNVMPNDDRLTDFLEMAA